MTPEPAVLDATNVAPDREPSAASGRGRGAGLLARASALASRPGVPWAGALLITLMAFVQRLWRLGEPASFAFDETYYAKNALSLLQRGYALNPVEGDGVADGKILDGTTTGIWQDSPEMVVHPEVGKWIIAAGEWAFGVDPSGWRMGSAIIGSLMVLLMCRFATRVTGSVALGWLAGLLLALDGLQLVLSRLALLDIFLAFFLLAGVHCVVADRQWFRRRLEAADDPRALGRPGTWGPLLLWRPWLVLAGISFGLAVGTKWTALYPMAVFGLWIFVAGAIARSRRGVKWLLVRSTFTDGASAFVHLVGVAFVVYVLSWTGWLVHADEYEQHLSNTQYTTFDGGEQWPTALEPDAEGLGEVWQSLRSLAHYHRDVYVFHTEFLNDTTHTYASKPSGWLLQNRPVGVDAQLDIQPGDQGCEAPEGSTCMRQVLLLGNPVIWWTSIATLLGCLVLWVGRRDWRFGVPVLGVASTWLPWLQYDDRTIFLFYAVAFLPFVVLSMVLCLGAAIGSRPGTSPRRTLAAVVGGAVTIAAVLAYAFFWPIWTDELITHEEWLRRMWFKAWI